MDLDLRAFSDPGRQFLFGFGFGANAIAVVQSSWIAALYVFMASLRTSMATCTFGSWIAESRLAPDLTVLLHDLADVRGVSLDLRIRVSLHLVEHVVCGENFTCPLSWRALRSSSLIL